MPYNNNQRRMHIIELQRYLHAISLINNNIPTVVPTGVYNNETIAVVKAFQREYNLNITGKTDSVTWDKVVQVYKGLFHMQPKAYPVFPSEKYVCEHGASGCLVYIIQVMLYSMGQSYDNFPKIKVCGNFNDETENAVKIFQNKCSIPASGKVDCITWNMLVSCSVC